MKTDFAGQTAIVTGAGSGIGRALALELAGAGARVIATDVDEKRLAVVVDELESKGARVRGYVVDHASLEQVRAFQQNLRADWSDVDILCSNVGAAFTSPLPDMTLEDWERVMAVNFFSTVYMVQLFVPSMVARGRGHVLVTASLAGLVGVPTASAYCASKFALVGLAESLRAELRRHGIGVTALCPGIVRTNFTKDGRFSFGDLSVAEGTLDRLWNAVGEDPRDVARAGLAALRGGASVAPSSWPLVRVPWLAKRLGGDWLNSSLAFAWAKQDRIAALAETRPGQHPQRDLHRLRSMSPAELDAMYARATTPTFDELDGEYDGVLLHCKLEGFEFTPPRRLPWKGKVFFRGGGGKKPGGANRWKLGPKPRRIWPFETRLIDSQFGGEKAVSIEYDIPGNPFWLRKGVFDELKRLRDGLYLGKGGVHLGPGRDFVFTWAVERR